MSKVRVVVTALAFVFFNSLPANADLVSMNIGEPGGAREPVKWVATLTEIDSESNIASFYYETEDTSGNFSVHVTRIFSIEFGPFEKMSRDFPAFNAYRELELPLAYERSRDRRRGILLDNSGGQANSLIPESAIVQPPSRDNRELQVFGVISFFDGDEAILVVSERDGSKTTITIDSSFLLSWVRG